MTSQVENWIKGITWLPTEHHIPTWIEAGIHHGFEGLAYELPNTAFSLNQVHGRVIVQVEAGMDPSQHAEADGLWTQEAGLTLAVKTADCVPILIQHPRLVMALHAGWRGIAQDILGAGLQIISRQGILLNECKVAIGSCLSMDSFEVGPEVIESFKKSAYTLDEETLAWCSSKGQDDRWHLDLAMLALMRLRKAGYRPSQLAVIRSCTKKNPMIWHSFRRDGDRAGRNWSWIRLD